MPRLQGSYPFAAVPMVVCMPGVIIRRLVIGVAGAGTSAVGARYGDYGTVPAGHGSLGTSTKP
jgi:hypothetical protein